MNWKLPDSMGREVSLEAAQAAVLGAVDVLPGETVALREALGRVVRQDAVCDVDCPTADVSAADGYCFASRCTAGASSAAPVRLRVVGTVRAGAVAAITVGDGECVEIMTGAPLPAGADTVMPAEAVEAGGQWVVITSAPPRGQLVTAAGSFIKRGETIGLSGRRATAQALAALAACGATGVKVSRRPRVGVVATGDEIVGCGTVPGIGQARASNLPMLAALASGIGCDVAETATVGDSRKAIEDLIGRWETLDAIVTSGGVAMGKFDLVPEALLAAGATIAFSSVRMRPGGRTLFGKMGKRALFCLPGSPAGALVAFLAIARPGLLAMMAISDALGPVVRLRTTRGLDKTAWCADRCSMSRAGPFTWLVTARLVQPGPAEGLKVEPLVAHGGRGALSLTSVGCLVRLGDETQSVEADEPVDVLVLENGWPPAGEAQS